MIQSLESVIRAYLAFIETPVPRTTDSSMSELLQAREHLSTADTINYIVNVYVDGFFCIVGFIGNILAITILHRDRHYNSNSVLLQGLAVFDLLLLAFTVFYTTLRTVYPATGLMKDYYEASPYVIAFALPFGWIAQTGTIWFTMFVAYDRYLAISHPFKAAVYSTVGNAKRLAVCASVTAVCFNFPRFFHYYLVAFNMDSNSTFISHIQIELPNWNSQLYYYIYHTTLTFLFLYILPLSTMLFCNHKLIEALNVAKKESSRLSSSSGSSSSSSRAAVCYGSRQNLSITLNIIIITSKFIICQTPDFIAAVLAATLRIDNDAYQIFATFKEMLLVINSAINFYIYLVFNAKFRKTLKQASCCCCCRRSEGSNCGSSCCCSPCCAGHSKSKKSSSRYKADFIMTSYVPKVKGQVKAHLLNSPGGSGSGSSGFVGSDSYL